MFLCRPPSSQWLIYKVGLYPRHTLPLLPTHYYSSSLLLFFFFPPCLCPREEATEYIEIGSLNGLFVLGRTIGFIGNSFCFTHTHTANFQCAFLHFFSFLLLCVPQFLGHCLPRSLSGSAEVETGPVSTPMGRHLLPLPGVPRRLTMLCFGGRHFSLRSNTCWHKNCR